MIRFLKIAFFGFLGLLLLYFALGFVMPTVEYGSKTVVDKPIKEAWAVFMDNSKNDQWLKGLQNWKLVEGEENKPGSKYSFQFDEGGKIIEMEETMNEVVPEKLFNMTLRSPGMMHTDMVVTFEEKDANTTVIESKATAKGEGMMMRSMFALMHLMGGFEKGDAEIYNNLKKVIEENQTGYFPTAAETVPDTLAPASAE